MSELGVVLKLQYAYAGTLAGGHVEVPQADFAAGCMDVEVHFVRVPFKLHWLVLEDLDGRGNRTLCWRY